MNSDFPIVAFVNDDTVVVSIVEGGESKLYLYLIANLNTAIKTIKLESLSRIGQVIPYHGNAVLINGQKNGTNNFFYYILNLDDETLKQFTFSSQSNSTDFNAAFSPDKQYFSFFFVITEHLLYNSIHTFVRLRLICASLLMDVVILVLPLSLDV